jgi:hypothetical protein
MLTLSGVVVFCIPIMLILSPGLPILSLFYDSPNIFEGSKSLLFLGRKTGL